jgi:tripartite-type tricarboxylate transporter receptor subunit TctC
MTSYTTAPLTDRRQFLARVTALGASLAGPPAWAQSGWPTKPLRLVVPFAPGGSSEIVARAIAGEMAKTLGQNVFVDNKPGAAGNIAMRRPVASASITALTTAGVAPMVPSSPTPAGSALTTPLTPSGLFLQGMDCVERSVLKPRKPSARGSA